MTQDVLDRSEATARGGPPGDLQGYIPRDRRRALAAGVDLPDRVHGAALFADISGFTPLTEVLANELGPQRGAEELTAHLNRAFQALIDVLDRYGGHVLYFSGDAITCWLDGDDGVRATACALAMQATMEHAGVAVTPGGATIRLAVKIAITVGAARRFVVGDPAIQRIDVLAGRIMDELAAAERQAQKGEVVLHSSALESLGERVGIAEMRVPEDDWREFGVVGSLAVPVAETPVAADEDRLPEALVRQWLLPDVFERLCRGHGEFLAELRPAYPLFLRFGGIDYDSDDAASKLDSFICQVQRVLAAYGGNLLNLTLGDKGAYLYAVFGSPRAHEDDAARAAAAALELSALQATTAARDIQIGITYGRLRSGTYGHRHRRTFTCIGSAVNLAARLMAKCPPGRIYVSEDVRRAAGELFVWKPMAPMRVKGMAEPVAVHALAGSNRRATRNRVSHALPLVGRRAEIDTLSARLGETLEGRGQIAGICAEAGMGKSRLVAEFVRLAGERGATVALGECHSFGASTAYLAWREIWVTLFRLDTALPADEQVRSLDTELAAIDPGLVPRAPLLATLLDLPIPDNDLTAQLDAKLRKTSLEGLLVACLRARAGEAPLVLVLEDCHWLDPLSRDLAEALGRALASLRAMLVLAYRPTADAGSRLGVEKLPHFHELTLDELDATQSAELIRAKLAQSLGEGVEPPGALVDLVTSKAQGNPFYIEELINFIRGQGVDVRDEAALARLQLPESLHSLILSRIDTLDESPRRTLKVASVLGRVFRAGMLPGVYPDLGGRDEVDEQLRALAAADLVHVEQEAERTYFFKHVVTQEVAYESIPYAFRAELHERCGSYIETIEPETVEHSLDLLAHHYWQSANLPKKREYLGRAGDAAQAAYANAAAISYFERLAPLVDEGARVDVDLKLGKVLELVGEWHRAGQIDAEALELAVRLDDLRARASCETALAEVARKQGRYDEAGERLERAAQGFREQHDDAGVGRVLHLAGTLAAQQGDYPKAIGNYEASLAIRERLGDKASMGALLSNLGVVAEYQGDFDGSRRFHERALALRTETGDRWAIAVSSTNVGMIAVREKRFEDARELFRRSMLLAREVGDAWLVAIGHNNLGNATRGLGDYGAAKGHYRDSLRAYRDYDDKWAMAFLLEDIGVLAALCGDAPVALELIGAADALREAIGAPRAPSLAEDIDHQLAAAVGPLSDEDRQAHRTRGRAVDLPAAVGRALAFCERREGEGAASGASVMMERRQGPQSMAT